MDEDTNSDAQGPLEVALRGEPKQGNATSGNQAAGPATDANGTAAGGGRGGFTTPGAVSAISGMASHAENFSDPIAGEAEAGAELLEEARRNM